MHLAGGSLVGVTSGHETPIESAWHTVYSLRELHPHAHNCVPIWMPCARSGDLSPPATSPNPPGYLQRCPVMSAGPQYEYLWADGVKASFSLRLGSVLYLCILPHLAVRVPVGRRREGNLWHGSSLLAMHGPYSSCICLRDEHLWADGVEVGNLQA